MRARWLAAVGMLALTQCLLDANGTGPAGTGGAGVGGDDDPSCVPACMATTECMTSTCVDGTCDEKPANPGTVCGDDDDKFCDGDGACKLPRGDACMAGDECLSDHCVDGFCCADACEGTCDHCNAAGLEGECVPRAPGERDPDTCDMNVACDGIGSCAPGEASWAWSTGDDSSDDAVTAVAAAPDGSSWVALQFDGTAMVGTNTFTSMGDDVLLVKLSNTGTALQTIQLGGIGTELVTRLAVDINGNVYAAGYFDLDLVGPGGTRTANLDDGFVVSLDSQGTHRWTRHFSGTGDERIYDLITLAGGGVAAGGEFTSELTILGMTDTNASPAVSDAFVVTFDAAGMLGARKPLASEDGQAITGLCQAPTGELFAAGTFFGEFTLDVMRTSVDSSFDVFVARLDVSNGDVLSSFQLGNGADQESRRIGCLPNGNLVLTGHFRDDGDPDDLGIGAPVDNEGGDDVFAGIFQPDGTLVQRLFADGSNGNDRLQGLAVDPEGNFTFAGFVEGPVTVGTTAIPVTGSGAVVAAKYTEDGQSLWVRGYDAPGVDGADAVATNDQGLVWIGGFFEDPLTFTPGTNATPPMVTSEGGEDGFVVRLSP